MKLISKKNNIRLDKYLKEEMDYSRSYIQKLIEDGNVIVNGSNEITKNYLINLDDEIEINVPESKDLNIEKDDSISFEIYYEDDSLAVINKPKNLIVHPSNTNSSHTLVNGLLAKLDNLSGINGINRPGIVHRIDKDTTGLLMVAKTDLAHESLSKQLEAHSVKRTYQAICYGDIPTEKGMIDAPIGRSKNDRKKMAVVENGKNAITHFKVLERFGDFTLIECRLETGRTHQIRVHMAYINHPIVGDSLYGPRKVIGDNGQYLHAKTLGFIHPVTNEEMTFDSELPDYFKEFILELRKKEEENKVN